MITVSGPSSGSLPANSQLSSSLADYNRGAVGFLSFPGSPPLLFSESKMQDYDNSEDFAEVVLIGNQPFLYMPGDGGGRLVPAKEIKSIIPDFRGTGSMVFFTDNDKAIKVAQTPREIANDLIAPPATETD